MTWPNVFARNGLIFLSTPRLPPVRKRSFSSVTRNFQGKSRIGSKTFTATRTTGGLLFTGSGATANVFLPRAQVVDYFLRTCLCHICGIRRRDDRNGTTKARRAGGTVDSLLPV